MQGTIIKVSGPLIVAAGMADVQMYVDVQVNFDGLTRFVDMFCDSFFVDWMVQDQIVRAQENVAEARSRVWEAVQQLRFLIGA